MALSDRITPRKSSRRRSSTSASPATDSPKLATSRTTKGVARSSKNPSGRTKQAAAKASPGAERAAASPLPSRVALPRRISAEERRRLIAETAYLKAERRGFRGNDPGRDWFEAEAEVDAMLLQNEISCE